MDSRSGKQSIFHDAMLRVARAQKIMGDSQMQKGVNHDSLVTLGKSSYRWSESIVEVFRNENPENVNKIQCAAGCGWCCRLPVFASATEIFSIVQFLRDTLSEDELERVKDSVEKTTERIDGWSIEKRKANFVQCPLLVEDSCSVYEVRPFVCRGYTSYDKEACRQKTEKEDPDQSIEGFLLQYLVPAYTRLGLQATVKALGIEPKDIDLIRGLHRALQSPSLFDKWLSGEPVFDDIAIEVQIPSDLS